MKKGLLGLVAVLAACMFWVGNANAASYKIAHVKVQNVNMVFIKVGSSFFLAEDDKKARWYSQMQGCSKSANLAGEVVLVSNVNNRMVWYGPKKWSTFMSTTDMKYVDTRINKELTCTYS